ncbi:SAM-dependent methyltransferase [Kovacikia minuta CCNUW1]|uniref:class I SAM-dependent methyltransferase n=1 Tax=Kovacikia minuta TaxID=2931930 RepID=UPI001CCE440C|nr:SAM-dependent methyltransferase [Kovacikia minuta]UBF27049.1 SAM-dependent methyltransferase [Kovacikia minuta CCNUW1]
MLLQSVSDTARAVAFARALETERPDALFHDPFARRLAGVQGEQIYHKMQGDRSIGWLVTTRTCILDQLILHHIQQGGDAILNLAAGLDTRPYRMGLPATLRWIEVDLPALLAYKQEQLAGAQPVCQLESIALDLTHPEQRHLLFSKINQAAKKVLVITEGLLIYLSPHQVGNLATALHRQPHFSGWLTDLVSPLAAKLAHLRVKQERGASEVKFQFAPKDGNQFFQPYGWQVKESRSLWQEAHQLNREVPFGGLIRRFPILNLSVTSLKRIEN